MSLDFTKELENNCYYKAVKQLKEGIQIFNFVMIEQLKIQF
jgi:hypothetical protein